MAKPLTDYIYSNCSPLLEEIGRQLDECSCGNGGCDKCTAKDRCYNLWVQLATQDVDRNLRIGEFVRYSTMFRDITSVKPDSQLMSTPPKVPHH